MGFPGVNPQKPYDSKNFAEKMMRPGPEEEERQSGEGWAGCRHWGSDLEPRMMYFPI